MNSITVLEWCLASNKLPIGKYWQPNGHLLPPVDDIRWAIYLRHAKTAQKPFVKRIRTARTGNGIITGIGP